jgi:hypothetical protein
MHPWSPPQKGDLNGDNKITLADAAIALAIATSGSASPHNPTEGRMFLINLFGKRLALMILQAAADAIDL